MTTVLSTLKPEDSTQVDGITESLDDISPSHDPYPIPIDAKAARKEVFQPPSWLLACGAAMVVMSGSLMVWFGTQNRPEMFDALSASLLTMVGVVPGFASVLFVDRPVLLLDRGRVAIRGWITPLLVGYGLIWFTALVSALACANAADPPNIYVRVAICCSLLATLLTPLIFAAVVRRLSPHASTEAVVAVAIGRHGTAMLAKNLRDVAVREFDAGDRPACEERLWGLASIAALSDQVDVRHNAIDELAFVVEHELLHDRDLALVGLNYLRVLAARRPELRRKLAEHFVDIAGAAITRDDVSGLVSKTAHVCLDEFADQADASLLKRLVDQAGAAPAKSVKPHLDLLLRWCPRAPQAARESAARRALHLVDRFETAPQRVDYRLALLEQVYGDSAGKKKLNSIREEAMRLAPDLLAGADRTNPTAPMARAEIRRAFERGSSALYLTMAEAVLDADLEVPTGAVDPRGALLGEYLVAAVRAQDENVLRELKGWLRRVPNQRFLRMTPGALVALRSVRDEIAEQAGAALPGASSKGTGLAQQIFDEWCWRTIRFGMRGQRSSMVSAALTIWANAHGKLDLPPSAQRSQLVMETATILRDDPEPFADLVLRLRPTLLRAAGRSDVAALYSVLYANVDATALTSDEVRTFLLAVASAPDTSPPGSEDPGSEDPDGLAEHRELRDWLSDWLSATPVAQVYGACDGWVAEPRDDLVALEAAFADWAGFTHPGPALLLGLKARVRDGHGARALTDHTWEWLYQDAAALLGRAVVNAVPDDHRYLTFCANTWFRVVLSGLVDGRAIPNPEVLADAVASGHVRYQTITSTLRFGAIRALPTSVRAALAPALAEARHPFESLRLHRGVLRERQLARDTLKQIEDLVRFDDRPTRAVDRALREVRSYTPANLVRYVGPSSVRSLLAVCLEAAVDAEQQELARQLLREADQAAKESKPPAGRIPSGSTMTASRARPLGTS